MRYGAFCDERGRMLGDGTVYNTGDNDEGILVVTALSTDGDHFRRAIADQGLEAEVVERTAEMPHLQLQGPKSRELLASLTDADIESLRYFRFLEDVTIGGVPGCLVSRTGYSGELGFEIYTAPENAERLWSALLDPGQSLGIRPYGLAAVESLRIESGLIFIGFDYFPAVDLAVPHESRSHDQARQGRLPRQGRARGRARGGITHRMATVVIAGEEAPDYNTPVFRHGREVGRLLSPSRRTLADRRPHDRHGLHRERADEVGTPVEVALSDGRTVPALVDQYPIYDPEKTRPRVIEPTAPWASSQRMATGSRSPAPCSGFCPGRTCSCSATTPTRPTRAGVPPSWPRASRACSAICAPTAPSSS